ncbi:acetolactate synthase [Pigmentiphaga sp. NML080357]|uniref:thiamine pyrophosphate-requiring protein n=1 Tax=Pigmentiphaga sp. NML080357 TaxID=2008675 RepID=UPI000B407B9C|nr:thiamine pyrophosphate-requiring protein [Pigmentiphaga sp. NML080357]OVZ60292.1 acetolactate synthase [Pigmentiphaga sp. NML080357]
MQHALTDDTRTTAGFLLEGLTEIGVDYLFCNMGTDHAPIIEELARRREQGEKAPQVIRCPHENTAAHMAAGYALVTGRGQGVLVHVDVGTANASMAMHNLFRSRLPVLLMAGKAPFTSAGELPGTRDNYVHYIQEPFDQGSLVRPFVKWEWTLPSGIVVKEALRRAQALMQSEPRGPVYLMLPRETLAEPWPIDRVKSYPEAQFGAIAPTGADPRQLDTVAERLLAAEHPILITSFGGRNRRTSAAIERLARLAGIRVFESNPVNNISHEGPNFCGFQPGGSIQAADVGLLVDTDVPWFSRDVRPHARTFWAQVDVDALKAASPMWSFPANARIQGDSARILEQLAEALEARSTPAFAGAVDARNARIAAENEQRRHKARDKAADPGTPGQINPHFLFAELGKRLRPEDMVFNEAVRNSPALMEQLTRPLPGTLVRVGGGGLGASGAMALGARLADPDLMAVQVVGDGSLYFNIPSSVLAVSSFYGLPILTLVVDNAGWSAVKESTLRVYPDGSARRQDAYEAELPGNADFAKLGEAFGAHGERVDDPAQVGAALDRCIQAVKTGRSAVLHAKVVRI